MTFRRLALFSLLLLFMTSAAAADFLEVSHRGPIRADSSSSSNRLRTVDPGVRLRLLDDGDQDHGYYHVQALDGLTGWMYRSLVRRFPGELPGAAPDGEDTEFDVTNLPDFEPSWPEAGVPDWVLRSNHFIYGMPRLTTTANFPVEGEEVPGISVLVREGFVVGHFDRYKVPLWVAMRWTEEDYFRSEDKPRLPRPFEPDPELPEYARAKSSYDGHETGFDRGHMARHKDNAAWGRDNSDAGCLMSNIAPQNAGMNRNSWLGIENLHRKAVSGEEPSIKTLWVVSGTVFEGGEVERFVGNEVGVPQATYKVVSWFDEEGNFQARGFILRQEDTFNSPTEYLVTVDEIEERTGIDFFPDLADAIEDQIEAIQPLTVF